MTAPFWTRLVTLPDDVPQTAPHRSGWLALALPVLITLVANGLIVGRSTNSSHLVVAQKWGQVLHGKGPVDGLVLGDSNGLNGVLPAQLGAARGETWENLCTLGSLLVANDAWQLQRYMQRFGPPRRVLLVHALDTWDRPISDDTYQLVGKVPLPWGFWHRAQPPLPTNLSGEGRIFVFRYLPLYAHNQTIGKLLQKPARALWDRLLPTPPPAVGEGAVPGQAVTNASPADEALGYAPVPGVGGTDLKALREQRDAWRTKTVFQLTELNRQALLTMMRWADEQGFELYIANGPFWEEGLAQPNVRAFADSVDQALTQLAAGHPRVHYLPGVQAFPAEDLRNIDHLLLTGARRFTQRLAERMAQP